MSKTVFEQRIEYMNAHRKKGEPLYAFSFVGETSPEAELELQTNFVLMLLGVFPGNNTNKNSTNQKSSKVLLKTQREELIV